MKTKMTTLQFHCEARCSETVHISRFVSPTCNS